MRKEKVEKRKEKIGAKIACLTFFILHFSLFICTCDLFNDKAQSDYLKIIDDEIAWSNAARLNLTVWYIPLWGTSPQQGELDRETHRQGHYFNVEFTPAPGYGFVDWVAFRTNGLDLTDIDGEANKALILDVNEVNIVPGTNTVGGAFSYKIKINITDPVTLVPLCSDRPRLSSRTYPPLNPVPIAFPYNQKIDIWFNMPVQTEGLELGEGKITVSGTYLINKGGYRIGDDFENHGDITDYFKLEVPQNYDGSVNHVTLVPAGEGKRISDLAYLTITVKVGPDINKKNVGDSEDIGMAGAESFSFMTDSSEMKTEFLAYRIMVREKKREDVQVEDELPWFGDKTPFDNPVDRRFRPGETISLKFDIVTQEDMPDVIQIVEQMAWNLKGDSINDAPFIESDAIRNFTHEKTYDDYEEKEISTYTFDYPIKTTSSGIIRLLVLPSKPPQINPFEPDYAKTILQQYVTIVVDDEAPSLANLDVTISNYSRVDNGNEKFYLYGGQRAAQGVKVTIENLENIRDNQEGGIPSDKAEYRPWTENNEKLYWKVRIGEAGDVETINWLDAYNDTDSWNNQWQSTTIIALDHEDGYPVYLKFMDRLGNETGWIDSKNKVKYQFFEAYPVTELSANCNEAGNAINVTWTEPDLDESPSYLNPQIEIKTYMTSNEGDKAVGETVMYNLPSGTRSYTIRPSAITTSGVLNGTAVSGVYGYEITVIAYDNNKNERANPIWVYNIPGMNDSNQVTKISTADDLADIADNLSGQYVLTHNIEVSTHKPISTFTGKFYGNGHTITINGMDKSSADMGLFGVADNALIRDLTVVYGINTLSKTDGTAQIYIGGITGKANNDTQISNCMVNGTLNFSSSIKIHAGGIAGAMNPTAKANLKTLVENCYSGINLFVEETGNNIICAGGIIGQIWTTANAFVDGTNIMINKVKAAGNVSAINNGTSSTGSIWMGGIVGECRGRGTIQDTTVSGTLTMTAKSTAGTTNFICGGIIGRMQDGNLKTAVFTGRIETLSEHSTSKETLVGGIVGTAGKDGTLSDTNGAKITVTDATAQGEINYNTNVSGKATVGGVCALSDGSNQIIVFTNCVYTGRIYVESTNSGLGNIGGFVGDYKNYTTFTNCRANASGITIIYNRSTASDITLNAGGFAGNATNAGQQFNGLSSNSPVVVTIGTFPTATLRIGGFVGYHNSGSITNCFAGGAVTVTSNHTNNTTTTGIHTGGFAGEITGVPIDSSYALGNVAVTIGASSKDVILRTGGFVGYLPQSATTALSIKKCFARGLVTVNTSHTGSTDIYTGGFGGYITGKVSIENSYTTGAVRVDKKAATSPTGPIKTGGFVGLMEGPASKSTINRSFSAGDVVSLYNWTVSGPKRINEAGGFAGGLGSTDVTQCVVASGNIWAQGGDIQAKRFVPAYGNCVLGNLANTAIRVYGDYTYNTTLQTGVTVVASGDYNGGDVSLENLKKWDWWNTGAPNFSSTIWNSSDLTRGYPLLLNMGGQ